MANITKREFDILDLAGHKYLEWRVDAMAHLKANGLEETVMANNETTPQQKARAIIFLRHHVHESLKTEYLFVEDPKELWESLKERYGHQNDVLLPQARDEWQNLRFQDFKSISDYNSALHRITSLLKLCGEEITQGQMLEKTYTTMHPSNNLLQQQYRERGYKKYSDLLRVLLVAEKNTELLMKNHNLRPTGSLAPPEANAVDKGFQDGNANKYSQQSIHDYSRGRGGRGRRGGRSGRGGRGGRGQGHYENHNYKGNGKHKVQMGHKGPSHKFKSTCHKCGMTGHWAKECRVAAHLVKLYQDEKNKAKNTETNFIENKGVSNPHMASPENDYNLEDDDDFAMIKY